jgi:nicotinamidase-related amidase
VGRDRAGGAEVSAERLDPARTCLLLFDFLEGHVNRDPGTRKRYNHVVANAEAMINAARRVGALVAHGHADHAPGGLTAARTLRDTDNRLRPIDPDDAGSHRPVIEAGTPEARIIRELSPEDGDLMVPKHRWSAFHGTFLDTALRARAVDTLILSGGSTDVGIASTAFAGRDLGYNLVIASDACTSPEMDNHTQLMKRVFPRMARVRTTAQILQMLEEAG